MKINANLNKKKFATDSDEYTISNYATVQPCEELTFEYNKTLDDKLVTVQKALHSDIYKSIDLNVKVMMKDENKQTIIKDTVSRYKCDTLVADETESIKLVLWEDKIDKVFTGRSYNFKNVTVRVFDDTKHLNTNESTLISEIEDIPNIQMDNPQIKDNLLVGKIVGVDIKKSTCCVACNEVLPTNLLDDMFTCKNCNITTMTSLCNTKVICQIVLKTSKNVSTYTCFNDAILSFLRKIKCEKSSEMETRELQTLLLQSNEQQMIVDKSSKIISHFLQLSQDHK